MSRFFLEIPLRLGKKGAVPFLKIPMVRYSFKEIRNCSSLNRLQEIFELSVFDLAPVTIALAPEIDLCYERIYAYLQDDVTRKRPSVDLAATVKYDNKAGTGSTLHTGLASSTTTPSLFSWSSWGW